MRFQNSKFYQIISVTDSLIVVIDMKLILSICICIYNCSINFECKILIFIVANKCRCVCLHHMSLCLSMCRYTVNVQYVPMCIPLCMAPSLFMSMCVCVTVSM